MNRISTIPITLDPSIYRPRAPARTDTDLEKGLRKPTITLAPAVYQPDTSRKWSATDAYRPTRTKDLPSLPPKSPWPVPERKEESSRRPRRDAGRRDSDTPAPAKSHSAPPSRQSSFYTEVSPERKAFSTPPSRKGTMTTTAPPRRPTIEGSSMEQPRAPPRRPSDPTPKSPSKPQPRRPSEPTPKSSTSTLSSTPSTLPPPTPPSLPPPRLPPLQTRYITMLLTLDTIPRLHNILASFFSWLLLAGFLVLPGTFTSLANLPPTSPTTKSILSSIQSLPFLVVATTCCTLGYLGNLYLMLRWRHNYIWLLNRLYMPGTLHALAGLISTLTNVLGQHKGSWSVSAQVAVGVEGGSLLVYGVLFVVYNNLLLDRVKREHQVEVDGEDKIGGLRGRVGRVVKQPSFAPGSVV